MIELARGAVGAIAGVVLFASSSMANPSVERYEWPTTDFDKTSVDFRDIIPGGPPKDGIAPFVRQQITGHKRHRRSSRCDRLDRFCAPLVQEETPVKPRFPGRIESYRQMVVDEEITNFEEAKSFLDTFANKRVNMEDVAALNELLELAPFEGGTR